MENNQPAAPPQPPPPPALPPRAAKPTLRVRPPVPAYPQTVTVNGQLWTFTGLAGNNKLAMYTCPAHPAFHITVPFTELDTEMIHASPETQGLKYRPVHLWPTTNQYASQNSINQHSEYALWQQARQWITANHDVARPIATAFKAPWLAALAAAQQHHHQVDIVAWNAESAQHPQLLAAWKVQDEEWRKKNQPTVMDLKDRERERGHVIDDARRKLSDRKRAVEQGIVERLKEKLDEARVYPAEKLSGQTVLVEVSPGTVREIPVSRNDLAKGPGGWTKRALDAAAAGPVVLVSLGKKEKETAYVFEGALPAGEDLTRRQHWLGSLPEATGQVGDVGAWVQTEAGHFLVQADGDVLMSISTASQSIDVGTGHCFLVHFGDQSHVVCAKGQDQYTITSQGKWNSWLNGLPVGKINASEQLLKVVVGGNEARYRINAEYLPVPEVGTDGCVKVRVDGEYRPVRYAGLPRLDGDTAGLTDVVQIRLLEDGRHFVHTGDGQQWEQYFLVSPARGRSGNSRFRFLNHRGGAPNGWYSSGEALAVGRDAWLSTLALDTDVVFLPEDVTVPADQVQPPYLSADMFSVNVQIGAQVRTAYRERQGISLPVELGLTDAFHNWVWFLVNHPVDGLIPIFIQPSGQ
ncbi:hypothetical protein LG634_21455 [Streptomyces bambusae]|uniref:hypothetical protein n=1 Tax=Streptomyces bambusae TaxID=1550616 RepID=UPI001CFF40F6|nr:hypothetical protein [Streptomyces bambusae]MCB5167393.1 hypothetical protein [Streptomyces bambusae]